MIRTLFSLMLTLAVVAEASAQATPGPPAKPATSTKATTRRPAGKMLRPDTRKATVNRAGIVKQAASPTGNEAAGSTGRSDDKGENSYAAPGEPINVQNGKVGPYNSDARSRHTTKGGTTLAPK